MVGHVWVIGRSFLRRSFFVRPRVVQLAPAGLWRHLRAIIGTDIPTARVLCLKPGVPKLDQRTLAPSPIRTRSSVGNRQHSLDP